MKTIPLGDIDLAVADRGAGRPVVLVHGFPLTHAIWEDQIVALSLRQRVIAPDMRGFGQSGASAGAVTMDRFADDLAALLAALAIAEPVTLAGLSMGGYIAMRFFQLHRQRLAGLVLCDTRAAADTPEGAAVRRQTADRVEQEGAEVLADAMLPKLFSSQTTAEHPERVEQVRQMIVGGNRHGLAAAARGLALRPDFTAILPQIDVPVLVIVGREDAISPPAEMQSLARAIPGARYVEIPAAGHLSPLEQPAEVSRALAEFLSYSSRSA